MIPTPAPVRGGPVDCIGGPADAKCPGCLVYETALKHPADSTYFELIAIE